MPHLREIQLESGRDDIWPFTIPAFSNLHTLRLDAVTFFVGENGSGKSTLLEAIAQSAGSIAVGREDIERDETFSHLQSLVQRLKLRWRKRTRRGFFLRAEDFFGYARRLQSTKQQLQILADGYEAELSDNDNKNIARDEAIRRARGSVLGQKRALETRYDGDLDARSHGESFLKLFQSRLVPDGLYLLDEPEAALSPLRQMALISLLKSMSAQNCQFIIATHSPILMAFPDAQILNFSGDGIVPIAYDDVEQVALLRAFLQNPPAFVRRL